LFRTIWDYFHRFDEFSKWLEETKHKTKMINPYAQIKWNVDKHYLGDLEQKGINIVKSHFIEKGDSKNLADWHQELGWSETVLKPCVSGGGRHTYRLNPDNYAEHEAVFKELIQDEAMMLQPFMKNVPTKGEVSHIVIGGQYSHSILKIAKKGDYRVQDDFGGSVHDYTANEQEIKYAESVAKACEPLPYYARVDVIWDDNDELALGEVELIEPELWFRNFPEAAKMLAREITSREFSV
jgi:glutathione synthase/RimK-type ligase-like ATP-grasp enzyme